MNLTKFISAKVAREYREAAMLGFLCLGVVFLLGAAAYKDTIALGNIICAVIAGVSITCFILFKKSLSK